MKKSPLLFTVILLMLVFSILIAKPKKYSIDDPNAKFGGLLLLQTNNGSGLGGFFEKAINSSNRLTANLQWLFIRGKNDYPIYDPYYDPYGYYTMQLSARIRPA